jgi:hypothetical protein
MDFLRDYWYILAILGGLLLLPYILGPVLIRFTLTQKAEPQLDPFPPDHPRLPREVARHFRRETAELEPLGWEPIVGLALPNQTPRVKAVLVFFINRQNKDAAIAVCMYADAPEGTSLQTAYVEIVTRYRDGEVVQCNNSDQMSAFPDRPGYTTGRFPMVSSATRLYRLHQALCKRQNNNSGKVNRLDEEFHGDAGEYLSYAMVEEMEGAAAAGYMYHSQSEGLYRPTWPGAFIMTWQELWPFKAIRKARRNARARRMLDDLEAAKVDEGE